MQHLTLIFNLIATICVCGLSFYAPHAGASPWKAQQQLLPENISASLYKKYPQIDTPEKLESLLQEISRRIPVSELEASYQDGSWIIQGKKADVINDIEVQAGTKALISPLNAQLQTYLGAPVSTTLLQQIKVKAHQFLKDKGYYLTNIQVSTSPKPDNKATLDILVAEGEPCLIRRIEYHFPLPDDTSLPLESSQICDRSQIEDAIVKLENAIRAIGFNQIKVELSDIRYDTQTNTADVVIGGVLGKKITYNVVDTSKRFILGDLFSDAELTNIDPSIVGPDAMAAELLQRYRNRGYIDATVKGPQIDTQTTDTIVYTYTVSPGKQYLLRDISFEGNKHFSKTELMEIFNLQSFWQTNRPYNQEDIQQGINNVKSRYQQEGFWNVSIQDPGIGQKDADSGEIRVLIKINEGPVYTLQHLEILGNYTYSEDELLNHFKGAMNAPLDRVLLIDFQKEVRSLYLEKGYLYTEATLELDIDPRGKSNFVTAKLLIQEGSRVSFGDIIITGLAKTHPKVVKRELLFESGDWYNPELINESRRALTRLGLFRSVQIYPLDRYALTGKTAILDMVIEVREGKAGSVGFGPGWNLYRGWQYSAEGAYLNIAGLNRQVSIRGAISQEKHQKAIGPKTLLGRKVGAGFVEPYIFSWPIDAIVSINQKIEASEVLWDISLGGELTFTHKLNYLLTGSSISAFYGQKLSRSEGATEKEEDLVASNVRIGRVGMRLKLDQRNNLRFPSTGFLNEGEVSWARYALGGDLQFFSWRLTSNHYFGLTENTVFALSASVAGFDNIARKDVADGVLPPNERIFSGGVDSVRGYHQGVLGPVVRGPSYKTDANTGDRYWDCGYEFTPLGGNRMTNLKTELRYRISDNLAMTGFIDSGLVFLSNDQMSKFENIYDQSIDAGPIPSSYPCAGSSPSRSIQENFQYQYKDLLSHPGYLWSRHYLSYGTAVNFLTALGAVNLAYGLPWREPLSESCKLDSELCYQRAKSSRHWLLNGEFYLNIGAKF